MSTIFNDFDFAKFWDNSDYAKAEYIGRPSTLEMIRAAEKELGYTLPKSYVEFVTHQNGGTPKLSNHRTAEATSWASDHVAIHGIYGVDSNLSYSLTGSTGYKNWIGNWGYPDIGIYFADCPSAGHDMICLVKRVCPLEKKACPVRIKCQSATSSSISVRLYWGRFRRPFSSCR